MTKEERYFLNGMIRTHKPKKVLEIGIESGGGTAIILNALSDLEGSELFSVDYAQKSWNHPDKLSGFCAEEVLPELIYKWHVFRGGDVSKFIEQIGRNIDMLVLDTVHIHPWETLNFICVLPFMKNDSWTILHDITCFDNPKGRNGLACRYLFI